MCGIVGHIGPKESVQVVLEGLKRLEYRGYDSAGVSFVNLDGEQEVFKKEGELKNLLKILETKNLNSSCSIGHTRWATHGKVTDFNAHPHQKEELSLVHNGIIENADRLREELKNESFEFLSETDSEVFIALISKEYQAGVGFKKAVIKAFQKVEGNSAFVVMNSKTKEILAIKKGAPLVCGLNKKTGEALVSSDPYALVGIAEELFFPEDGVLCLLSLESREILSFCELDEKASTRYLSKTQEMSYESSEKGEYEHYMLKEIHEQPELMRELTQFYFHGEGQSILEKAGQRRPSRIYLSACGTASYAGMVMKDYFERFNRIPSSVELASEFRYRDPILEKDDLCLFISQSGETADTLAAFDLSKQREIPTMGIVNVEGSALYRGCDQNLLIRAGIEIGVASTKAFTQMALTGRLLSFAFSKDFQNASEKKKMALKFNLLADRTEELLKRVDEIKSVAEEIYKKKGYFFTGRNQYYSVTLEGALKLKEIAYVHAEGYASGELKHGPIALIDEEMVNIAIVGPELYEKTVSNIQEIKTRKGIIVTIGPENDQELQKISDYYIGLNFKDLDELAPLYVNVANQLLAYYMAKFKGTDIDKPRNLAKSVTVE